MKGKAAIQIQLNALQSSLTEIQEKLAKAKAIDDQKTGLGLMLGEARTYGRIEALNWAIGRKTEYQNDTANKGPRLTGLLSSSGRPIYRDGDDSNSG